jgi:putative transposase
LWKSLKTSRRANHDGEPGPIAVQIAGTDAPMMAEAAIYNIDQGAQIIDINMGCPAKKVCNKWAGSALMQNETLAIEIDTRLPAGRVIRTLEQLGEIYGLPQAIRLDNGPELRSAVMTEWCEDRGIELRYIQSGKPSQNAFIERFNRTYRHEVLNAYLFEDLDQVREITDDWITVYNEERPHGALGKLTPRLFTQQAENSTSSLST